LNCFGIDQDADLPPIIEKDVAGIPLKHEESIPESGIPNQKINQGNPVDIEELPFVPENNEKAIVLFKPMNNPIFYSPNNLSIDPSLISSFKSKQLLLALLSSCDFWFRNLMVLSFFCCCCCTCYLEF